MAFHIDSFDLPPLRSYSDALNYWTRIKPWRGHSPTDARPLANRGKHHMTIRKLNDNSIAMTLHSTDVVTYHPDGDVSLQAYGSVSTDAFARALTPDGVGTHFNNGIGYVIALIRDEQQEMRLLRGKHVRLRRDERGWFAVNPDDFTTFTKTSVDRKKANAAAKEYRLNDYLAWRKAAIKMGMKINPSPHNEPIIELLKEGDFPAVAAATAWQRNDYVKKLVYRHAGAIIETELPVLSGWIALNNLLASSRRW
jgi:hypothetical protein